MPLLFLSYANLELDHLPTLAEEYREVSRALSPRFINDDHYTLATDPIGTSHSIGDFLSRYHRELFLFHFSGHAGRHRLELEDGPALAGGLAHLLGLCPKLRLVVLNGCSTAAQVARLRDLGVPVVIATSAGVEDAAATRFAVAFYGALARGETIGEAFELGVGAVGLKGELAVLRGRRPEWAGQAAPAPDLWGIFYDEATPEVLRVRLPDVSRRAGGRALPLPAAPLLFGREGELRNLVGWLTAEPPRSVLISGTGGVGKSGLCLAALHDPAVAGRFGAQRFFVRLDGATSYELMLGELANVLGLEAGPDLERRVFFELGRAPALLALDNAETPWQADSAALERLLGHIAGIAGLTPLLTMRGAEAPEGLPHPELLELRPVDEKPAREIFLDRSDRRFADDPVLPDLLNDLEGLPLAIVLMAAQARTRPSLGGLRRQWLEKRTELLRRGSARDRLDNLEVSLALSVQSPRMTEEGRRLFALLGRLPDGVAYDNLEVVAPGFGEAGADALRRTDLAFYDRERLKVLAPVREYAARRYPPAAVDWDGAVDVYCGVAKSGEKVGAEGGREAAEVITGVLGNIQVAIAAALERTDPVPGIEGALGFSKFSRFTGLGGKEGLIQAIEAAERVNRVDLQANCIRSLGAIAFYQSDHAEARRRYAEAMPIYEQVGDLLGKANCIQGLGDIAFYQSDNTEARRRYAEAMALYQQVSDLLGQANCMQSLGDIAFRQSDHAEARRRYAEAMPIYEQVGDLLGQANCIQGLGDIASRQSDNAEARRRYAEAMLLFEQVGSLLGQANCIRSLGDIALRQSDHTEAHRRYAEAMPLYEQVGDLLGQANCIRSLGDIAFRQSDNAEARRRYAEAMPLFEQVGDLLGQANCVRSLGDIALRQSDTAEARRRYAEAMPLFEQVDSLLGQANCIRSLGDILKEEGDKVGAMTEWQKALAMYQQISASYSIGWTYYKMAEISEGDARSQYAIEAKTTWKKTGYDNLVKMVEEEFGV